MKQQLIDLYQVSEAEMVTGSVLTLTVETQTLPGDSSATAAAQTSLKVLAAVVVETVIFFKNLTWLIYIMLAC